MNKWYVLSLVLFIVLIGGVVGAQFFIQDNNNWFGMMGPTMQGFNGEYELINSIDTEKEVNASLTNATIDSTNNSIRYTGEYVNIVMIGGPEDADEKFVIGEMINPTIFIPKNAKVTMKLINEDEGMPHGIELTSVSPPYSYMTMMQGGFTGIYVPVIPNANGDLYPVAETTFTANRTGEFYYICQVPGHAEEGMYGKIIIE